MTFTFMVLLIVLLLHRRHSAEIRALQAGLKTLVKNQERLEQALGEKPLTDTELQQARILLARDAERSGGMPRRNRDQRPSLF